MGDKKIYPDEANAYKLLEEVGEGSHGSVYRAICLPLNEVVAIKILDLDKSRRSWDEISLKAETWRQMNHPNVVKLYSCFLSDRALGVVMPFMAGGSCLHIMKAHFPDGFEEPVIATILKETLKALEYLHRQRQFHRDVKAGNILVDADGRVRLGGVYGTYGGTQSTKFYQGTPCWMAPEVMQNVHDYDFKADIWSFGITALELAHGHAPFSQYPPLKVLLKTLQNVPSCPNGEQDKHFSKSFKEMVAMCLVKDPIKRPTAEKLLKHTFFKSARSSDYIFQHVLDGLPPLWECMKVSKLTEAALVADKRTPLEEQEERSQNEYKRGVNNWSFDIEDLKMQCALIKDDGFFAERGDNLSKQLSVLGVKDLESSSNSLPDLVNVCVPNGLRLSAKKSDAQLLEIARPHNFLNGAKSLIPLGRKDPKHIDKDPLRASRSTNDLLQGNKDVSLEKSKGTFVQRKGRFHVTSDNVELVEAFPHLESYPSFSVSDHGATVPVAAVMTQMQSFLHQTAIQQEMALNLITSICPGEASSAQQLLSKSSFRNAVGTGLYMVESNVDREHELLQQAAELQSRIVILMDELQSLKSRNIQLERQLNAIYNEEEEERIRREEASKEEY
ncbi:hypothetical protein O6H91_Y041400 [Diphasiastrum complanatum]|nr:hypothetical protein O6H91_Y041400 [Diphasiastrum complanatum]